MASNPKSAEHVRWLRANGHGAELGALTGTDARALAAIAACWQLYAVDRSPRVIEAVASIVGSMQPKCGALAGMLIPWALDWSDEAPVWGLVLAELDRRDRRDHPPLSPVAGFVVEDGAYVPAPVSSDALARDVLEIVRVLGARETVDNLGAVERVLRRRGGR